MVTAKAARVCRRHESFHQARAEISMSGIRIIRRRLSLLTCLRRVINCDTPPPASSAAVHGGLPIGAFRGWRINRNRGEKMREIDSIRDHLRQSAYISIFSLRCRRAVTTLSSTPLKCLSHLFWCDDASFEDAWKPILRHAVQWYNTYGASYRCQASPIYRCFHPLWASADIMVFAYNAPRWFNREEATAVAAMHDFIA